MKQAIITVVQYFSQFSYPPSLEEIHLFLQLPGTIDQLTGHLNKMVTKKTLITNQHKNNANCEIRYTLPQYSWYFDTRLKRYDISLNKIRRISLFLYTLSRIPWIQFVGISGSVAMFNAEDKDDIDIFIITSRELLWTGRMSALLLSTVLGIRRKRNDTKNIKNKVCLNLFFDEKSLIIPHDKRTEYIAHEILQCIPMYSKNSTYERFLHSNNWIYSIFPNAKTYISLPTLHKLYEKSIFPKTCLKQSQIKTRSWIAVLMKYTETILKHIQMLSIQKHITTERITETQLWFFPHDFEKQIKQNLNKSYKKS